jgi:diguanylate cyclase (GGDEF)-like protein
MPVSLDFVAAWAASGGWAALVLACAALAAAVVVEQIRHRRSRRRLHAQLDAATSQLENTRQRDSLTGLVKRGEFESALELAAWNNEHQSGQPVAVLCVGVDDLRGINDGLGPQVADALLAQLGQRLAGLPGISPVLSPRVVARVGAAEFALLLAADEAGAIAMANHVGAVAARPYVLAPDDRPRASGAAGHAADAATGSAGESGVSGVTGSAPVTGSPPAGTGSPGALGTPGTLPAGALGLTVSVGLACYPAHGAWSRLLRHAAAAMRHVQQSGGNGHAVFAPAMSIDLREQALLLQDLRQAMARGELKLLYQPKIDAASLQITAAEALLRWEHPVRGLVSPAVFIPLAERHGLMPAMGQWVIDEACRQAGLWRDHGLRMRIAINISGHQLRHDRFVAGLEQAAARHHVPPGRLTCEITESVAMEDTAQTRAAFQRLRRAGFHVSIDDFGTGHSSLAVLRRLPAAELKVDRHFIIDLETSESARAIVEAVVGVARTLGMRVVAEGVETLGQRDLLVEMGCDELQGFLFARPMSAAALLLWADACGPEGACSGSAAFRPSLFSETRPSPVGD